MSNLTENKLNTIFDTADITAMNNSIADIANKLPIASLTEDQRGRLNGIDVDNKVFVEDVITEIGISGAGILPPFINGSLMQTDLTLFSQLDALESSLNNLLQTISDLKRIAGDEAYGMSTAIYKMYEAANAAGIPGAKQSYDKLKVRYDKQGGGRKPDAPIV